MAKSDEETRDGWVYYDDALHLTDFWSSLLSEGRSSDPLKEWRSFSRLPESDKRESSFLDNPFFDYWRIQVPLILSPNRGKNCLTQDYDEQEVTMSLLSLWRISWRTPRKTQRPSSRSSPSMTVRLPSVDIRFCQRSPRIPAGTVDMIRRVGGEYRLKQSMWSHFHPGLDDSSIKERKKTMLMHTYKIYISIEFQIENGCETNKLLI
ncbi:Ubiquitin ligase E3 alphalike [Caligus rogercresseyi]|uniref:Ubiquitin ligase E3 alphalike n=1 Tax=Caligus rogercresseyi TaxID=217165 RepID=A0A7T8GXF7_CALRO|nr:Ubiquitin ligase E3 alphalike [Caligus rogercresseyi]